VIQRGFEFQGKDCTAVVLRMCYRDDAVTTVGGAGGVPFVIRREDLPPMPKEPLLDLVDLDRTLRPRATLTPRSSDGGRIVRFAVRPRWQDEDPVRRDELLLFARRVEGTWTVFARDDAAMDLVAVAANCAPRPFVVPALVPGAELPAIAIEFVPR
jgi:hypothetical protein